jgi:hypothetical protein
MRNPGQGALDGQLVKDQGRSGHRKTPARLTIMRDRGYRKARFHFLHGLAGPC